MIRVEVALAARRIAANQRPCYLRLSRAGERCLHATVPADIVRPTVLQHGADAVVLATEWPAYVTEDPTLLADSMRGNLVLDARNALDPASVRAAGLRYEALGRTSQGVAPSGSSY